jgi:hypothetical protein
MDDEELAAELAEHLDAIERAYRDQYRRTARAALAWLAEQGRLIPDGGLTRTEWAVTTPRGWQIHTVLDEAEARTCVIYGQRCNPVSRQVTNWPDGTTLTTSWVPVEPAPTTEEQT